MIPVPERGLLRLFFALWPDDEFRAALAAVAGGLRRVCGGRAVASRNLHMTLAFLGNVPAARLPELQVIAAGLAADSFVLSLDCIGWWRAQRVVWAGTEKCPRDLEMLAAALAGRLQAGGFRTEARRFVPHVTLLRNAGKVPPPEAFQPLIWRPRQFVLVRSEPSSGGVRYRIAGKWPLQTIPAGI